MKFKITDGRPLHKQIVSGLWIGVGINLISIILLEFLKTTIDFWLMLEITFVTIVFVCSVLTFSSLIGLAYKTKD